MNLSLRQLPAAVNNRASIQFRYYNSLFNAKFSTSRITGNFCNRVSNLSESGLFCASGNSVLARTISQGIFVQEHLAAFYSTVSFYILTYVCIYTFIWKNNQLKLTSTGFSA